MSSKGYEIGVDLGTKNTLVYVKGKGIVYNEPTVVSYDSATNVPIAVGQEAHNMIGKENIKIKVVKPLEGGVIADFDATQDILKFILKKLNDSDVNLKKSTLLICCPSEMTSSEQIALKNLAKKLNISDVFVEPEVKAGAIGAGIDIFAPTGSMIIDIGGGSTDIGVLSLGDLIITDSIRIAGNYIDKEIIKYVKYKYYIAIGERTAEKIKINIGTLSDEINNEKVYAFAGRSLKSGLPTKMEITQSEVRAILIKAFDSISTKILNVLQGLSPEISSDILEQGIVVNGGGALIDGIESYLNKKTHLSVRISDNPMTSIVEGTKYLLKNRGNYLDKPTD